MWIGPGPIHESAENQVSGEEMETSGSGPCGPGNFWTFLLRLESWGTAEASWKNGSEGVPCCEEVTTIQLRGPRCCVDQREHREMQAVMVVSPGPRTLQRVRPSHGRGTPSLGEVPGLRAGL